MLNLYVLGLPSSSSIPTAPTNVTSTKSFSNFVQAMPISTAALQVQQQQTLQPPTYVQPSLTSVYTTLSSANPSQQPIFTTIFQPDPQQSFLQAAQQQQQQQLMTNPFLLAGYPTPMLTTSAPQPGAPQQLFYPAAAGVPAFQTAYAAQAAPFTTASALGYGTNATVLTGLPGYSLAPGPYSNGAQLMPPPVTSPNSLLQTPPNIKRKLPIPPSPEASPEGSYIGQHSQGLGGHYADSYWRNKRSKN